MNPSPITELLVVTLCTRCLGLFTRKLKSNKIQGVIQTVTLATTKPPGFSLDPDRTIGGARCGTLLSEYQDLASNLPLSNRTHLIPSYTP